MSIKMLIALVGAIFVALFCARLPAEEDVVMDTAQSIADLLAQGDKLFNARDYEGSREAFIRAAQLAESQGKNSERTEAYAMVARTHVAVDQLKDAREFLALAVKTATPREPLGWSRYLSVRGRIEWKANNLNKAAQTFKEMYHYCSQNKLHDRAVDAANMVAITGSSAEQIEWGKKGIAEAEAGSVGEWLGPLWNNLGAAYEDQEQYDSALQAYLKARDYHYQYGDEKNKMIADWAVGHAYRLNGRYDDAAKWLRPLPAWSEKLGDIEFQGWSWKELGQIEYHHGNYQLAAEYLLKARDFLLKAGIKTWDPKGYSDFIQLLEEVKRKSE